MKNRPIILTAIVVVFLIALSGLTGPFLGRWSATFGSFRKARSDSVFVRTFGEGKNDVPAAVRADGSGNVYVAGTTSAGPATAENDIVVIKYRPDGRREWTRRYDGFDRAGRRGDEAVDLAVDAQGNAVVVGTSTSRRGLSGIVAIKYSSRGRELWVNRYGGTGNPQVKRAAASGVTIDSGGEVFVSGLTDSQNDSWGEAFALIKYDSRGEHRWTRERAVIETDQNYRAVLGQTDQIYVAGAGAQPISGFEIDGSWNLMSLYKYDSNGNELANMGISAPERLAKEDAPSRERTITDAVVAENGNVIVLADLKRPGETAPEAFVIWSFESSPDLAWVRKVGGSPARKRQGYRGLDLETHGGAVYVLGARPKLKNRSTNNEAAESVLIKYDSRGERTWTRGLGGAGSAAVDFRKAAVGPGGNIILAGTTGPAAFGRTDIAIVKLGADGKQKWSRRYGSRGLGVDRFVDLDIDAAGNVLVTGISHGGGRSIVTIKYAP